MRWLCFWMLLGSPALAGASLDGLTVTMHVLTQEASGEVLFETDPLTRVVGEGPEYGLSRDSSMEELDVVPVLIDISANAVKMDYRTAEPGYLHPAAFNGYVLRFDTPCALFKGAAIDPKDTNLPFEASRVTWEGAELRLNVRDLEYNRKSRIAIDLDLNDCPAPSGSGRKIKRSGT